jgi:4-amino-4-deoxy-L-arabinose transferase-like glycosyltransferase
MSRRNANLSIGLPAASGWRSLSTAGLPALMMVFVVLAGLWNLGGPEPWWDEGWTLSVARTFVERGHYGRLLNGAPAPGGLEASPAVTLPVALSFNLLGVGLWQGRLFGVLCTAGVLALLFWLSARLFDRRVAFGALVVALLLPAHPQLNALLLGRQVLGELPMLLWLLGGYACLLAALGRSALWIIPAALLWALARYTKSQATPFLVVSLVAVLLAALGARRWRPALVVAAGLVGALFVAPYVVNWPANLVLAGRTLPGEAAQGIYEVMALVLEPSNRVYALTMLLAFGLPALLGIGHGGWRLWRERGALRAGGSEALVRLALWAFAASWTAWYGLLSVGVPRYFFPACFVAVPFTAALLHALTGGFVPRATLEALATPLRARRFSRASAAAWLATLLVATALPLTLLAYGRYYPQRDEAAVRVAAYLHSEAAADDLIETYEAELHFFLARRYHYPPDQVHVELNRRSLLGQQSAIRYDALAADPEYLVIGRFARGNGLYSDAVRSGAFELVLRDGQYDVYRRARS